MSAAGTMIPETDKWMVEWAQEVLGPAVASLRKPEADQKGVSIHLLSVQPEPMDRLGAKHRLQARLRYLVTAGGEASEAHASLDKLLTAAMQDPDLEIEAEALATEHWIAFGLAPEPHLVIRKNATYEPPVRPVKLVKKNVFEAVPLIPFTGRILGPGGAPIPDAQIEYPALRQIVRTDVNGQFAFRAVPADQNPRKLVIRAKGRESTVEVKPETQQPIAIQIGMED
jgi:hypothetical protein